MQDPTENNQLSVNTLVMKKTKKQKNKIIIKTPKKEGTDTTVYVHKNPDSHVDFVDELIKTISEKVDGFDFSILAKRATEEKITIDKQKLDLDSDKTPPYEPPTQIKVIDQEAYKTDSKPSSTTKYTPLDDRTNEVLQRMHALHSDGFREISDPPLQKAYEDNNPINNIAKQTFEIPIKESKQEAPERLEVNLPILNNESRVPLLSPSDLQEKFDLNPVNIKIIEVGKDPSVNPEMQHIAKIQTEFGNIISPSTYIPYLPTVWRPTYRLDPIAIQNKVLQTSKLMLDGLVMYHMTNVPISHSKFAARLLEEFYGTLLILCCGCNIPRQLSILIIPTAGKPVYQNFDYDSIILPNILPECYYKDLPNEQNLTALAGFLLTLSIDNLKFSQIVMWLQKTLYTKFRYLTTVSKPTQCCLIPSVSGVRRITVAGNSLGEKIPLEDTIVMTSIMTLHPEVMKVPFIKKRWMELTVPFVEWFCMYTDVIVSLRADVLLMMKHYKPSSVVAFENERVKEQLIMNFTDQWFATVTPLPGQAVKFGQYLTDNVYSALKIEQNMYLEALKKIGKWHKFQTVEDWLCYRYTINFGTR